MPDRFGPRGVIALFIPLQNANMQPEYEAMRPKGVSNQIYRFSLARHDRVPEAAIGAIDGGLGCWPKRSGMRQYPSGWVIIFEDAYKSACGG